MIDVKNLRKSYQTQDKIVEILKVINIHVNPGDFMIIMGESGSGKTTFLNCVSGFDTIDEGSIEIGGTKLNEIKGKALEQLRLHQFGFIFQDNYLIDNLTILENVAITRLQYDAKAYEKAIELLKKVHIDHLKDNYPSQVSGGEKQRCAIARALVNEPKILFADEPTAALDRQTADEIMNILSELNKQGQTILMVTHSPRIAAYGTRMVFVESGVFECDEAFTGDDLEANYQRVMEITER